MIKPLEVNTINFGLANIDLYSDLFKALGHPVRLQIVLGLSTNHCHVNQMVEKLNLPQPTVSQHLSVLRNAKIITPEKNGVLTCYKITDPTVLDIIEIIKKNRVEKETK